MDISVVGLAFLLENQMSGILIRGRTVAALYWIDLILPRMLHALCLSQSACLFGISDFPVDAFYSFALS